MSDECAAMSKMNSNTLDRNYDDYLGPLHLRASYAKKMLLRHDIDLFLKTHIRRLIQRGFPKNKVDFFKALDDRLTDTSILRLWEVLVIIAKHEQKKPEQETGEQVQKYQESAHEKDKHEQKTLLLEIEESKDEESSRSEALDKKEGLNETESTIVEPPEDPPEDPSSQTSLRNSYATSQLTPFGVFPYYPKPKPQSFEFDPKTGYSYDKTTFLHYHRQSGYFFNTQSNEWLFYSTTYGVYIHAMAETKRGRSSSS